MSQPSELHSLDARRYAFVCLVVAAVVAVSRWPLRSHYLFSWDAAIAEALDSYDVA